MSIRLQASARLAARPDNVWDRIADWEHQGDWIPLTDVSVVSDHDRGLGVRIRAFSGWRRGRWRLGLPDSFIVTGWSPPWELEVLHLGPVFTGEGIFRLEAIEGGTEVSCTELIMVPGGPAGEMIMRMLLPLLRYGLTRSLRKLGRPAGR